MKRLTYRVYGLISALRYGAGRRRAASGTAAAVGASGVPSAANVIDTIMATTRPALSIRKANAIVATVIMI